MQIWTLLWILGISAQILQIYVQRDGEVGGHIAHHLIQPQVLNPIAWGCQGGLERFYPTFFLGMLPVGSISISAPIFCQRDGEGVWQGKGDREGWYTSGDPELKCLEVWGVSKYVGIVIRSEGGELVGGRKREMGIKYSDTLWQVNHWLGISKHAHRVAMFFSFYVKTCFCKCIWNKKWLVENVFFFLVRILQQFNLGYLYI